jgi:tellurite resistance protein
MSIKLPRQAFMALAAVAWADGNYQRNEGAALLRAAKEHGLEGEDFAALEASTKQRVGMDAFEPSTMSEWEKVVTYALAAWLAQLDGVVSTEEHVSLRTLHTRLGLTPALRDRAAAAAFDVSVLPDGRPDKYDFTKLVARLQERMPNLAPKAAS